MRTAKKFPGGRRHCSLPLGQRQAFRVWRGNWDSDSQTVLSSSETNATNSLGINLLSRITGPQSKSLDVLPDARVIVKAKPVPFEGVSDT